MRLTLFTTIACLLVAALAAPSPAEYERAAAATCSTAYNGNASNKRGPGTTYSCANPRFVVTSYICDLSGVFVGTYCCSGNVVPAGGGFPAEVGGCFPA